MTNCYIIVLDTTKERTSPEQMGFFKARHLYDISGFILHTASRNGSPVDAIRIYVAPDKKTWMKMAMDYQSRVIYPGV